jgi:hypothetical protein
VGDAVPNDNGLTYAEYRNAAVLFKIKTVKMFVIDIAALADILNTFGQF